MCYLCSKKIELKVLHVTYICQILKIKFYRKYKKKTNKNGYSIRNSEWMCEKNKMES